MRDLYINTPQAEQINMRVTPSTASHQIDLLSHTSRRGIISLFETLHCFLQSFLYRTWYSGQLLTISHHKEQKYTALIHRQKLTSHKKYPTEVIQYCVMITLQNIISQNIIFQSFILAQEVFVSFNLAQEVFVIIPYRMTLKTEFNLAT